VLARLLDVPGVRDARVECSGTYFLVVVDEAAAPAGVLPGLRAVLGPGAREVEDPDAAVQVATRAKGEPWFSVDDVRGLSYVEARLLSTRLADGVAQVLNTGGAALERLVESTRTEIVAALEHAHDTGGRASSGWFWEEWPRIAARIAARLDGAVAGASRADLERALVAQRGS
jgi:hypothetical protein